MLKYEVFYRDKWTGKVDSFVVNEETVEDIVRIVNSKMMKNNWQYLYQDWIES